MKKSGMRKCSRFFSFNFFYAKKKWVFSKYSYLCGEIGVRTMLHVLRVT